MALSVGICKEQGKLLQLLRCLFDPLSTISIALELEWRKVSMGFRVRESKVETTERELLGKVIVYLWVKVDQLREGVEDGHDTKLDEYGSSSNR